MNRKNISLAAVIFCVTLLAGCSSSTQETSTDETTTNVVTENTEMEMEAEATSSSDLVLFTAMTNRLQSQLSELAQEKATSPSVKEASQVIAQHNEQIMAKVQDLAEAIETELPMTLSVDQQAVYDSLSTLASNEFEQAYVEVLQRDIKKNLENLESLAAEADNSIIRGLAADITDLQQPQLETVEELQQQM